MTNPFKQINDLVEGSRNHHDRLINLELFQRGANQRISDLEKETVATGGANKA